MTKRIRTFGTVAALLVLLSAGGAALAEVRFTTVGSGGDAADLDRTVTDRAADRVPVFGVVDRTASEARNVAAGTTYRSGRGVRSAFDSGALADRSGTVTRTASERRMAGLPVDTARGRGSDLGRSLPADHFRTVTGQPD